MYSYDQIREAVLLMQNDQGPLILKMREVLLRYEGDWVLPMPELANEPRMPQLTPALVGEAVDQIALRAASTADHPDQGPRSPLARVRLHPGADHHRHDGEVALAARPAPLLPPPHRLSHGVAVRAARHEGRHPAHRGARPAVHLRGAPGQRVAARPELRSVHQPLLGRPPAQVLPGVLRRGRWAHHRARDGQDVGGGRVVRPRGRGVGAAGPRRQLRPAHQPDEQLQPGLAADGTAAPAEPCRDAAGVDPAQRQPRAHCQPDRLAAGQHRPAGQDDGVAHHGAGEVDLP